MASSGFQARSAPIVEVRPRSHRGAATEAAGAVGRQDSDVVRQGSQGSKRSELGGGQVRLGVRPEEVRAAGAADHQAAAGGHGRGRAGCLGAAGQVMDRPAQVLRGVTGRRHGHQAQRPDLERVAVIDAAVGEGIATAGRRHDLRPAAARSSSAPDR